MKEPKEPVSDAEFLRLHQVYLERKSIDRRATHRVEKPIDIKPSVAGERIVNWAQYLELVERGEAHYPPKPYGSRC